MAAGSPRTYSDSHTGYRWRPASEALGISTAIGILVLMGIATRNTLRSRKRSMA